MHTEAQGFLDALMRLDRVEARQRIDELQAKFTPIELADVVISPALQEMGAAWEKGELALAQVYMAGRICEDIIGAAYPCATNESDSTPVAIAVLHDRHMLGKRIVLSVLRLAGIQVKDYGTMDVPHITECVIRDGVSILLVSTLMLHSALRVADLKKALAGTPVRIAVGGAPFRFDSSLWKKVGADAAGNNASDAITIVRHWMKVSP